ncbi:VPLPA-CTERM sorting domain-containing protein [uncultured Roseovarius sp.]|uniref:VPLPA-CTERM sorting domain-containing protein n=1 Tax=uncultured Roseovarius sp. TaxID=293344 RepID=UPI0026308274|nr:VPLPA-CTERM sorting domain-containing protein [uncultured Roseovarius sp.]
MLKTSLSAAAIVVSLSAGAAHAVTVDFNNIATGFYAAGTDFSGITFDSGIQLRTFQQGAGGPGMDGNIARQFGGTPFRQGESIGGAFNGFTVSSLSLVAGDSGGDIDIINFQAFDSLGNLVDETGAINSRSSILLSLSGTGIASFFLDIEDVPQNFNGSSNFDNITFAKEAAVVPLPASLPLLGAGLVAMGVVGRRRKKT